MPKAFYEALAPNRFASTSATVGPWDPQLSHGSPPATLLAHVIEKTFPKADARVGRMPFDFYGPVPVAELAVETEVMRAGTRVELTRARKVPRFEG